MRKVFSWMSILIVFSLVACSFAPGNPQKAPATTPTKSGDQMQTEISQMLTMMPTNTGQPAGEVTPAPALPTVAVLTETPAIEKPAVEVLSPTPTAEATETPRSQITEAGFVPTVTLVTTVTPGPTITKAIEATATTSSSSPPTSTDPMDNPYAWNWPTGRDLYTQARFVNGRQSIRALTTKDGWRMANPKLGEGFSNIRVEATLSTGEICQKDNPGMADHYGIIVRVPDLRQPYQGYLFSLSCIGAYSLRSWNWDGMDERRQEMRMLIDWTTPKTSDGKYVINPGTRVTNKMRIDVIGSVISLYANGTFLGKYDYSTNSDIPHLSTGYFGVFVGSRNDTNFTIWVDEMSYWENP